MVQTNPAINGKAEEEALAMLRESATPDLYYRNGFRVLELPVDATPKDVNRRKQMVEMAATNGVPLPPGTGRCFPSTLHRTNSPSAMQCNGWATPNADWWTSSFGSGRTNRGKANPTKACSI